MTSMTPREREQLLLSCLQGLLTGKTTEGEVLKTLRKKVLGMNQEEYAAFVGVSRRTLSDIENDTGSQSIAVINAVFKPIGFRAGLFPTNAALVAEFFSATNSDDIPAKQQRLNSFKRSK